jgi:glycosyltransferase involved in cell wall biosynthesis
MLRSPLRELSRERDLSLRLVGAGTVSWTDLPVTTIPWSEASEVDDIKAFDVGVMPLIDGPFERGKCGFKLIQYMACGVPVIGSPVGVNREIIRPGVNGFWAETTDDWVAALRTLIDNPALREQMGAAGRRIVENEYSLQVTAPKLTSIFRSVI